MFGFPQILSIPVLTNIGTGTADWPTVGAILAWTLVVALVGSGLGVLRQGRQDAQIPAHPEVVSHENMHLDIPHPHQEAA